MTSAMELLLVDAQPAVNLHTSPHTFLASKNSAEVSRLVNKFHQHVEKHPDIWVLEHVTADTEPVDVITRLGQVSATLLRRQHELRTGQVDINNPPVTWKADRKYGTGHILLLIEDIHHVLNPRAEGLSNSDREERQTAWFLALRLIRLGQPASIHLLLTTTNPDAILLGREFTDWISTSLTDS